MSNMKDTARRHSKILQKERKKNSRKKDSKLRVLILSLVVSFVPNSFNFVLNFNLFIVIALPIGELDWKGSFEVRTILGWCNPEAIFGANSAGHGVTEWGCGTR